MKNMSTRKWPQAVLATTFLAASLAGILHSQNTSPAAQPSPIVIEHGKFRLHKFEQAIGEETYEIAGDGNSLAVKMDFKFTDRGTPVPLSATFRSAQDLTPQAFEVKGKTARPVEIDEAVRSSA